MAHWRRSASVAAPRGAQYGRARRDVGGSRVRTVICGELSDRLPTGTVSPRSRSIWFDACYNVPSVTMRRSAFTRIFVSTTMREPAALPRALVLWGRLLDGDKVAFECATALCQVKPTGEATAHHQQVGSPGSDRVVAKSAAGRPNTKPAGGHVQIECHVASSGHQRSRKATALDLCTVMEKIAQHQITKRRPPALRNDIRKRPPGGDSGSRGKPLAGWCGYTQVPVWPLHSNSSSMYDEADAADKWSNR
jgi:hypothetical protein